MKMDIFTLLNLWKSNKAKVATANDTETTVTITESVISGPFTEDADDDSFFELELTLPNSGFSKFEHQLNKSSSETPPSPVTVLRSPSPKLRDFRIGNLRRKTHRQDLFETDCDLSPRRSSTNSNLFTVKFRIEDGSIVPKFSRCNSSSLVSPSRSADESYESSRRFSNDFIQKYLRMMKHSFVKSSKKEEAEKISASPARVTASFRSPRKEREEKPCSRFKVKCKQLGKSKSSPAMIVSRSPLSFPARNDHPSDGIEGAILHCKRSFNSTGISSLSRCSSDPSHEKSIKLSEEISKKDFDKSIFPTV